MTRLLSKSVGNRPSRRENRSYASTQTRTPDLAKDFSRQMVATPPDPSCPAGLGGHLPTRPRLARNSWGRRPANFACCYHVANRQLPCAACWKRALLSQTSASQLDRGRFFQADRSSQRMDGASSLRPGGFGGRAHFRHARAARAGNDGIFAGGDGLVG